LELSDIAVSISNNSLAWTSIDYTSSQWSVC